MIRVGFTMAFKDRGWMGGVNNLTNLIHAVCSLSKRRIEPVVLVAPDTPAALLSGLPATVEIVRTPLVDGASAARYVRRIPKRVFGRDPLMELFLRSHDIAILSHSESLGFRASIPTIGYIADFSYRYMPEMYDPEVLNAKDAGYQRVCRDHDRILLHSLDAQKDLADFFPTAVMKSAVLHVVPSLDGAIKMDGSEADLRQRYAIEGPFFYLPNQFWVHKNHRVVIDALALLKSRNQRALVLATGLTQDQRQPAYFDALMKHVNELGVSDEFRVLGLLPYQDVVGLMRGAVAVINPSLFEGWGLSVAEAKSMGKTVILSDLPVFREQAPEHGHFFAPRSAEALADTITRVANGYSEADDLLRQKQARDALPHRIEAFGLRYEEIVIETLKARQAKTVR